MTARSIWLLLATLALAACPKRGPISPPGNDTPPTLRVFLTDAANRQTTFDRDGVHEVPARTVHTVYAGARSPGGVQSVELHVRAPDGLSMMDEKRDTPDGNGNVATALGIGLPGKLQVCGADWLVTATARNYNGQTTTVTVTVKAAP